MKAPAFELLGVDGKRHSPASARGDKGLVVMFICNHCPYVKRSIERIVRDCAALKAEGFGAIAVMPNDPGYNPEDSFDNMRRVAREKGFPFPYVIDESQDVARLRRGLHPGFLRLRREPRAALPRPSGGAGAGHDRQPARQADEFHRLLDQVEEVTYIVAPMIHGANSSSP